MKEIKIVLEVRKVFIAPMWTQYNCNKLLWNNSYISINSKVGHIWILASFYRKQICKWDSLFWTLMSHMRQNIRPIQLQIWVQFSTFLPAIRNLYSLQLEVSWECFWTQKGWWVGVISMQILSQFGHVCRSCVTHLLLSICEIWMDELNVRTIYKFLFNFSQWKYNGLILSGW